MSIRVGDKLYETTAEFIDAMETERLSRPWYKKLYYWIWHVYYDINGRYWQVRYFFQRMTRGYSEDEVFNFNLAGAKWMLPRLQSFRENLTGYPSSMTEQEWNDILDSIIDGISLYVRYECGEEDMPSWDTERYKKDWEKIQQGFELLGKYWVNLWD